MQAFHRSPLAPTGCTHSLSVRLSLDFDPSTGSEKRGTLISHLITARDCLLQVWEVREFEKHGQTTAKLQHLLSRRLHGTITALARVRTLASKIDGADRVLISFLDAKMSLMEWAGDSHDILPISLHTFEKLPQVLEGMAKSVTDPASRISVMLLPTNTGGDATLAILPFFQEDIDLESMGVDANAFGMASLPYAPSHLLPLASLTSSHTTFLTASRSSTSQNILPTSATSPLVRNVIDMVFLPGFNEPTLALLYSPQQSWSGRTENVNHNCLVSLVTLANNNSTDVESIETSAILIATSPFLPYSSLSIHPCPPDLGGLLIVTANGLLHLEQGGKVIGVASNGWFSKDWLGTKTPIKGSTVKEGLEGCQIVFIANDRAMIFCRTGTILELTIKMSGRSVSSLRLESLGTSVAGSCVERIRGSSGRFGEEGYVFVGSQVGEMSLMKWVIDGAREKANKLIKEEEAEMDLDDEDDLYDTSKVVKMEFTDEKSILGDGSLLLSPCDIISAYGGIRSITSGSVGEDMSAELVAATGGGVTAGLTAFHRSIPTRHKQIVELGEMALKGIWSIPIQFPGQPLANVLITSTLSATTIVVESNEKIESTVEDITIAAGSVDRGALIARITPTMLYLSTLDFTIKQTITLNSTAIRATISEDFVLIWLEDKTIQLFCFESSSRNLVPVPLPPAAIESLVAAHLFLDSEKVIPLVRPGVASATVGAFIDAQEVAEEEDDLYATAPKRKLVAKGNVQSNLIIEPSLETGANGAESWQWLPLIDSAGNLEIISLPRLETIFASAAVTLFPDVIEDGHTTPIPEGIDSDDTEVDQIACFNVGQTRPRPHLLILLKNGALAIYEAFPSISASTVDRPSSLAVRFVKTVTRRLPVTLRSRSKAGDNSIPSAKKEFISFESMCGYSGVFMTGEDPIWILASDHGPVRLFDHAEKGIYSFSKLSLNSSRKDYITQSKTQMITANLPTEFCFDRELPFTRIPRDRRYGSVVYNPPSGMYVGGALFETEFMNFDEEGVPVFVNDSDELLNPHNMRSALELILPGSWEAIHGYEFRPNEFISTVKSAALASASTLSGKKDFIAVGTTVYRGEDLAARGGVYIFEVIKIIPDPSRPTHDHQLKLLFFEDTKSVVGNLCAVNGYLVMSMGQKLYVRAFEQDEVLLAVAFLDVGVHVTSLESMKNFLLIGDALKSVTLVAFQEDPYKLVILGRDYRPNLTTGANFLVNDGKVAFIMNDPNGVLRMFEYEPTNIASFAGQKLLCRTEYHAGAEAVTAVLYAKRSRIEKDDLKQNGILYACVDGSMSTLIPVRDVVYKRLQSLQTAILRNVEHFGGLNPRGYRIVKNDSMSRAITKGILDGELLAEFERLSLDQQYQLTTPLGTDPDTVLLNLRDLAAW